MKQEIQILLDQYMAWLKDKTQLREINDFVEITTLFLDRHNDYLQLYVKRHDGGYLLTDDGYTIDDLRHSGCDLETDKRKDFLTSTLQGFGVQLEKGSDAIVVKANAADFPVRKHNIMQAMLAVNDLFFMASPYISSLFFEDVSRWLEQHDIRYTPHIKLTGRSGFDYMFDFVVPKSRQAPERIVKAINKPSKSTAQEFILSWLDTRESRENDTSAYALLNDTEESVSMTVLDALQSYDIKAIPWSRREEVRQELVA